jgi:spore germination cell wall hydrolase CwlJ-like protein
MIKRGLIYIVIASTLYVLFMQNERIEKIEQHEFAVERNVEVIKDQVASVHEDIEIIKEALLVRTGTRASYTPKELDCMTRNIYYEAGVEEDLGKYAVAQVTLNRKKSGYWGKNICNVVYAKAQFSWTFVKARAWSTPKNATWDRSNKIAIDVLNKGTRVKPLKKALFYHASYVSPSWRDNNSKIMQIGEHIFYTNSKGSNYKL